MREWILRLIGTAMIASAAVRLTPDGVYRKVTRLVCSLALISALLSIREAIPLFKETLPDPVIPAISIEEARNETRFIIEKRLDEYIVERARALGLDLTVSVTARWSDEGYWYPYSVRLEGEAESADRLRIGEYIARELMIPKERQEWIN